MTNYTTRRVKISVSTSSETNFQEELIKSRYKGRDNISHGTSTNFSLVTYTTSRLKFYDITLSLLEDNPVTEKSPL